MVNVRITPAREQPSRVSALGRLNELPLARMVL